MSLDLPTISEFLSRPIIRVEVALPSALEGKWPWPPKVRTNFVAIRTNAGSLLFHYGAVVDPILTGIYEDEWWEGYSVKGTLTLIAAKDEEAEEEALRSRGVMESPEPLELIDLATLYPDAGAIYVPGSTACEVSFRQLIRDGRFVFDVSGIRIYSSEATTLLERGSGARLECEIQSGAVS